MLAWSALTKGREGDKQRRAKRGSRRQGKMFSLSIQLLDVMQPISDIINCSSQ